jgi:mevalonate pyrophosphate decarboxylase
MPIAQTALTDNNWLELRSVIERQSRLLHQVVATSVPPFVYIQPVAQQFLRDLAQKIDPLTYAVTFDAGTIPHIITTGESKDSIIDFIGTRPEVEQLFINQPGLPTRQTDQHLF